MTRTEVQPETHAWTVAVATACGTLLCLTGLLLYSWLAQPPTLEDATAIAESGELIAYSTADRRPHMLMIDGDQLVYDRLRLDWRPLTNAETPDWRLTDDQYRVRRTPTPANASLLLCAGDSNRECDRAIDLVGEISSRAITHVEIAVDGQWERHLVFGQGFIIPLDRRRTIGDVRWLNVAGEVVWALDRDLDGQIAAREPGQVAVSDLKQMQAR